ncbi:hypothetical protein J9303_19665 [Bacillaceae bacterium Marseille-Q3522]|nr:hypothetical protein [Bacillaceae bacterium Marseille-Q3522]
MGLLLQKKALEQQNEEITQQANDKMLDYYVLIKEYHKEMKKFARKYNIEYEPQNYE